MTVRIRTYPPAATIGQPPDWTGRAACRRADPDLFAADDPDDGHGGSRGGWTPQRAARARRAAAHCHTCPVTTHCATLARSHTSWGVFAGAMWLNGQPHPIPDRGGDTDA